MALLPLQLYNDVADRCWQNLQGTSIAREVQVDARQAMDKVLRHMAQEVIFAGGCTATSQNSVSNDAVKQPSACSKRHEAPATRMVPTCALTGHSA